MPIMEWNDSLNLGMPLIDEHHRHLVALVNSAHDSIEAGDQDAVFTLLNELVDYATYHFAAEELWMRKYSYPRVEAHEKEHEDFCVHVVEQEMQCEAGNISVLPELISFLSTWLVEHIQISDGDYGNYARSINATHEYEHLTVSIKP